MNCLYLFLLISICNCQNPTILEMYLGPFRTGRDHLNKKDDDEVRRGDNAEKLFRIQKYIGDEIPFPCSLKNPRSNITPSSVHTLRPGDIDMVGAIGDSLTAGFGATATNILSIFVENRGMVFTIGGQGTWREYLTLPNMLKEYNPNLFGFSLGPSITSDRKSQFNVAEVGAISSNIPYMTKLLIKRILRDPRVNLDKHWKIINVFFGSNDFCNEICYLRDPSDILEIHRSALLTSLRLLRDNLPRTFVNVILPPDISVLTKFTQPTETCYIFQRIQCPCFVGERFKAYHNYLRKLIDKFTQLDIEIANYNEFDRDDFTVVIQPMFLNVTLPTKSDGNTDKSLFSVDCFHFSQKGNSLITGGLWNNILEPVGQKSFIPIVKNFKCPSEGRPYLATRRNSL